MDITLRINIGIQSAPARVLAGFVALLLFLLMAFAVLRGFVTGVLADDRVSPGTETLLQVAHFVPDDARVQEKLARAEFDAPDRDLKAAEAHAQEACDLSPWNFQYESLLASIEDAAGNQAAAISALDAAARLAPNDSDVRWRLANFLVREGRLAEAAGEFKSVCSVDADLLPLAMDTMWQASGRSADQVIASAPDDTASQLNLAAFLLSKSQVAPAVNVFERLPRRDRATAPVTAPFIDRIITSGQPALARRLWADVNGMDPDNLPLITNGGFESKIGQLSQFNWRLSSSKYAEVAIDSAAARTGSRSLKIDFKGLDTTVLDREVTQELILQPGKTYTLEWYVKSAGLSTPEGPRIVVTDAATGAVVSASNPLKPGSYDWEQQRMEITGPASASDGAAVVISVKRKPKFSYDEPTRGTIWLDDFTLSPK